jgi:hypothetical protein
MKHSDMMEAYRWAKEFTRAVDAYNKEYGNMHKKSPYPVDTLYTSRESGCVRHWSMILTRALAKLRKAV